MARRIKELSWPEKLRRIKELRQFEWNEVMAAISDPPVYVVKKPRLDSWLSGRRVPRLPFQRLINAELANAEREAKGLVRPSGSTGTAQKTGQRQNPLDSPDEVAHKSGTSIMEVTPLQRIEAIQVAVEHTQEMVAKQLIPALNTIAQRLDDITKELRRRPPAQIHKAS